MIQSLSDKTHYFKQIETIYLCEVREDFLLNFDATYFEYPVPDPVFQRRGKLKTAGANL